MKHIINFLEEKLTHSSFATECQFLSSFSGPFWSFISPWPPVPSSSQRSAVLNFSSFSRFPFTFPLDISILQTSFISSPQKWVEGSSAVLVSDPLLPHLIPPSSFSLCNYCKSSGLIHFVAGKHCPCKFPSSLPSLHPSFNPSSIHPFFSFLNQLPMVSSWHLEKLFMDASLHPSTPPLYICPFLHHSFTRALLLQTSRQISNFAFRIVLLSLNPAPHFSLLHSIDCSTLHIIWFHCI